MNPFSFVTSTFSTSLYSTCSSFSVLEAFCMTAGFCHAECQNFSSNPLIKQEISSFINGSTGSSLWYLLKKGEVYFATMTKKLPFAGKRSSIISFKLLIVWLWYFSLFCSTYVGLQEGQYLKRPLDHLHILQPSVMTEIQAETWWPSRCRVATSGLRGRSLPPS